MLSLLMDTFRNDLSSRGHFLSDRDWSNAAKHFKPVRARRGETLLNNTVIAETLIFVCKGVAASIQTTVDGDRQIARFFENGQLCSNVTSAWTRALSEDELVTMSEFSGISIPFELFRESYMFDGPLGPYWREKVIETLLFDKDLQCAKTVRDVSVRYDFLRQRYRDVIGEVSDRYIAQFRGITPQGLSRFLKNNRAKLT
ncbi:MAG: hypothetical protein AAFQ22_08245 [Pseudomonadota bacterium]